MRPCQCRSPPGRDHREVDRKNGLQWHSSTPCEPCAPLDTCALEPKLNGPASILDSLIQEKISRTALYSVGISYCCVTLAGTENIRSMLIPPLWTRRRATSEAAANLAVKGRELLGRAVMFRIIESGLKQPGQTRQKFHHLVIHAVHEEWTGRSRR